MYPEDRVLVTTLPRPADFARLQQQSWYRIPQRHVPKGLYAEYFAFYFGGHFGSQKWAIHYYAPRLGHELTTRRALLPNQPDHPRADDLYYKVQLGKLRPLSNPIVSLHWRRITFVHTTWDRFQDAAEINDLYLDGDGYVNRQFTTLKESVQTAQSYTIKEKRVPYGWGVLNRIRTSPIYPSSFIRRCPSPYLKGQAQGALFR